ncbi:hypothetical protein [Pseudonocardia oroxyli]|uniref:Uncharacterized protein n=1 Tax=Pseudonocardia oroxyli TaxID=366584 RepID=A0A1G8DDS0_PSEOR|nr:hypothetical protein [Pseudonocardia oroxyli]SDH55816.1 hypothetical protein SAMN05216377_12613 [Pseudonocardia oroxyli]
MSDRESVWARRAAEATGSRPVTGRSVGGGVLADIDALLVEEEQADSPKDEDGPPR